MELEQKPLITEDAEKAAESPNEQPLKCLRHRIETPVRGCWLCRAKQIAEGRTEYARKLYIHG